MLIDPTRWIRCATLLGLCNLFIFSPISALGGNITLDWDESPDASVISYRLYYGTAVGVYTNSIPCGSATTMTVSNLVEGVTYYFAATASDTNGLESVFSNETSGMLQSENRAPTLNALANVSISEDAGAQTVNLSGISSGATNEAQSLVVTAVSSNPALIPTPSITYTSPNATGSLAFAPVASAFGTATITVTVNDGGASNNAVSRSFVVTVISVNDQPTLNVLTNRSISEDAGSQTVNLSGISSGSTNEAQSLVVTAISSNPALIPAPSITYTSPNVTGSIAFTPVASAFGTANITVTVNDGGTSNNTVSRSFTVTVVSVNDQPTLNSLSNISIDQDSAAQTVNLLGITSGAANEVQTLTLTATSSNPGLVPVPTITYNSPNTTGSLILTPVSSAFGSATITVTVNDGAASNNTVSRSFTVNVNQVNQPPAISAITNRVIAVNAVAANIPFSIGDSETSAANLTLSANSDDQVLVPNVNISFSGSGSNRTVSVTPAPGKSGVALISILVSDGTNSVTSAFQLSVVPRPSAPGNLRARLQ